MIGAMLLAHQPAEPLASYVEKLWYCDGYQVVQMCIRDSTWPRQPNPLGRTMTLNQSLTLYKSLITPNQIPYGKRPLIEVLVLDCQRRTL